MQLLRSISVVEYTQNREYMYKIQRGGKKERERERETDRQTEERRDREGGTERRKEEQSEAEGGKEEPDSNKSYASNLLNNMHLTFKGFEIQRKISSRGSSSSEESRIHDQY